ncbi:ATP-binding cassette domain-containing protein [Streptococcus equi]|uniref:ATP-binding cassette domain-containing protein n=1 Tax=Streptococcus equi TaxID=1336 RepID=UPI002657BFAD|nr:ATP-binding cassette domain-containing protein [Streptococcus equi]WKF66041.1 ATP-binding cassette domain-containing protein [Streptococcus equi subsp. zooepidemicus]
MERLIVNDLSAYSGSDILLSKTNLDLSLGSSLVIVGRSGSGKTLLTKLLIGQCPSNVQMTGRITCQDMRLDQLDAKQWQSIRGRHMAYMVQNPMAMFNPFQTIGAHLLETIRSHERLSKRACLKRALPFMRELYLEQPEELLRKYPFELSGGMLQRVMLAILLCLDPQIIILDEPTSALDDVNRSNIIRMLKLLQDKGKTIITVTHDYQLAQTLGGELLVMSKGKVIEQGSVESIFHRPSQAATKELLLQNHYDRLIRYDRV